MSAWRGLLALLWALGGSLRADEADFARGVEAYRRADYDEAKAAWSECLAEPLDEVGRARVYANLGNAHWRAGEALAAVACYTAAVRLDPRNASAWENLEWARAKAGLAPADSGDLGATATRVLEGLRPDERRALLWGALFLWALVWLLEVRFGGAGLRAALFGATVLLALAALPWAYGCLRPARRAPSLVIASGNVSLRAEPSESMAAIGELAPLEEVETLDELGDWKRVERVGGLRGWLRAESLYTLRLSTTAAP